MNQPKICTVLNKDGFVFKFKSNHSSVVKECCDIYTTHDFDQSIRVTSYDVLSDTFVAEELLGHKLICDFDNFIPTAKGDLFRALFCSNEAKLRVGCHYYLNQKYYNKRVYIDAYNSHHTFCNYEQLFLNEETNVTKSFADYWQDYMFYVPHELVSIDNDNRTLTFKIPKNLPTFNFCHVTEEPSIYYILPSSKDDETFMLRDVKTGSETEVSNLYTYAAFDFIKLNYKDDLSRYVEIIASNNNCHFVHHRVLNDVTEAATAYRERYNYKRASLCRGEKYRLLLSDCETTCVNSDGFGDRISGELRLVNSTDNLSDYVTITTNNVKENAYYTLVDIVTEDNTTVRYFSYDDNSNDSINFIAPKRFCDTVRKLLDLNDDRTTVIVSNMLLNGAPMTLDLDDTQQVSDYIVSKFKNYFKRSAKDLNELAELHYILYKCCTLKVAKFMYNCISVGTYTGPIIQDVIISSEYNKIDFILSGYDSLTKYLEVSPL